MYMEFRRQQEPWPKHAIYEKARSEALDSQLNSKGRFFFVDWHPPSLASLSS